jgi:hypothetical protein
VKPVKNAAQTKVSPALSAAKTLARPAAKIAAKRSNHGSEASPIYFDEVLKIHFTTLPPFGPPDGGGLFPSWPGKI